MESLFEFPDLKVEYRGNTGLLTISRASALNALNRKVLEEIDEALDKVLALRQVKVLIFTGEGEKAFVSGADIEAMENMSPQDAEEFSSFGQRVFTKIQMLPVPTIAAINGYALGGGNELAMACDIRIAAANARFGQPEVNLGIIPGFGGTQRLSRIVGPGIALELILTGRMISADEALRIGLVHEVVPQGEALKRAEDLALELEKKPPAVLRAIKEAVLRGSQMRLEEGLNLEKTLFARCFSDPNQKEGMRAFLEKRKPRFV